MSTHKTKQVLLLAGGTGGHIFPALALAKEFKRHNFAVNWLGTKTELEAKIIPNSGINFKPLPALGVRGKGIKGRLCGIMSLFISTIIAVKFIWQNSPLLVVGFGGYVTIPGGLAAKMLGKKLILHEQNAVPGFSNKVLSYFAFKIAESFPDTFKHKKAVYTGNLLRQDLTNIVSPRLRQQGKTGPIRILVLGGSQGATIINQVVSEALHSLLAAQEITIWHQTGAEKYQQVVTNYTDVTAQVKIEPFITDMSSAYQWADLVISRAGAGTVTELAAVGVASILIPLPWAVDDHQNLNANYLQAGDAAVILPQQELTNDLLPDRVKSLMNRELLLTMGEKAYSLGRRNGIEQMIKVCLEVINDK